MSEPSPGDLAVLDVGSRKHMPLLLVARWVSGHREVVYVRDVGETGDWQVYRSDLCRVFVSFAGTVVP